MINGAVFAAMTALPFMFAGAASAQPVAVGSGDPVAAPAYSYYVVPCDTPGAIVTGSVDVRPRSSPAPACIVAVSAAPQGIVRGSYATPPDTDYDNYYGGYWPGYYSQPYYGVGFGIGGGGHYGGGHFGGFGGGHGFGGFGGGHGGFGGGHRGGGHGH